MAFSGIFMACSDDEKVDPCVEIIAKSSEKVAKIAEKYAQEQTAENCKKEVLKTLNCEELEMKENIVGKWLLVKFTKNGVEEKNEDNPCSAKKPYTEFLVDNTLKKVDYNQDCKEDIDVSHMWEIKGNLFSVKDKEGKDKEKDVFIIKSLTAEEFVIQFEGLYSDDKKTSVEDEVIYYFKRMK